MRNTIIISILSFVGAILFAFPQALLIIVVAPLFIINMFNLNVYISMAFLLSFAFHIAKLVQHFHNKSREK
jgi:ABC-type dipeptide/oligopeptide/nickel transport system permease subunit